MRKILFSLYCSVLTIYNSTKAKQFFSTFSDYDIEIEQMRLTMKIICAVARLEMKPAFNDIRELTSLCIASGCSPEKRDSIYFRLFNKLRQC